MDRSNTPINLPSCVSEPNLLSLSTNVTNGDKTKRSKDIKPFSYYTGNLFYIIVS